MFVLQPQILARGQKLPGEPPPPLTPSCILLRTALTALITVVCVLFDQLSVPLITFISTLPFRMCGLLFRLRDNHSTTYVTTVDQSVHCSPNCYYRDIIWARIFRFVAPLANNIIFYVSQHVQLTSYFTCRKSSRQCLKRSLIIRTSLCGRDGRTICGPLCVPKSTCLSL